MRRGAYVALVWALACGDDGSGAEGDAAIPEPDADTTPCVEITRPAMTLDQTGLYCHPMARDLGEGVRTFRPQYELWSDGALKKRWFYIPPGETITTSSMSSWLFPIGTKFWKEFTVDGKRIETRLLEFVGPTIIDWTYQTYAWDEAQETATITTGIQIQNALGTTHDIPSFGQCIDCHGISQSTPVGFSAILLDYETDDGDVGLAALAEEGLLSANPAGFTSGATGPFYPIPGAGTAAQPALGYLHVNCGGCHNPNFALSNMNLRLPADAAIDTVVETPTYTTTFNIESSDGMTDRLEPGVPLGSRIYLRMLADQPPEIMPPTARETVDTAGLDLVQAWICELAPCN